MTGVSALTGEQASYISRLAAAYGTACLTEGMAAKIPGEEQTWRNCTAETARTWQALQDAIWDLAEGKDFPRLTEGPGGVKSAQAGADRPFNEIEGWVSTP